MSAVHVIDVPRNAAGSEACAFAQGRRMPVSAVKWRSSLVNRRLAVTLRASDLGSVTLGSPLDPVVGGSLEDAFCCLI